MKKNNKIITANVDNIRLNNEDDSITEIEHILELKEGWNLVAGSILNACEIIDENNILEKDEGNFLIYKFSETGYTRGYSFQKGIGYWVRSSAQGQLKLVEKTEGIVKDETVETIGKTVVTIIESSNTIDQTNKDIENIVKPNSTQTPKEVKETINKTGSTLEQQADEGQNLVNELDKAVANEDPQLLNDLLDQARDSMSSNGRKKKNKRKAKKKLRIVSVLNKFDKMYNDGKKAEKECGDWANGNGVYDDCSSSLKTYFTSMSVVGNDAKTDTDGYSTTTEYYKSNSAGTKIPSGNYKINAHWDAKDSFYNISISYNILTFTESSSNNWYYDDSRKIFTNAVVRDSDGWPTYTDGKMNFNYVVESKWLKFFRVQDDANTDDDALYFGITNQYDSDPSKTPKGSFVGVKKEIDWVRYKFKRSQTEDVIELLVGVLESPIDTDNYEGTKTLDSNTFEIKELVIKSNNQVIINLFKVAPSAEFFNDENFALHGGLKGTYDNSTNKMIYPTFEYDGDNYNFFIKFGSGIKIKMKNEKIYVNGNEYDENINYELFEKLQDTPIETADKNSATYSYSVTGGINHFWFVNKKIDFTEELKWYRYDLININAANTDYKLNMIIELGVSKTNVNDVSSFTKGDKIKNLIEIKEVIFRTSEQDIINNLKDLDWSILESQNDNNYALFSPDDDTYEYPDTVVRDNNGSLTYDNSYKFRIYGYKGKVNNGIYVVNSINLFLDSNDSNYTLGLQIYNENTIGLPNNNIFRYVEGSTLTPEEIILPTNGLTPYKTFNVGGGLNKVYIEGGSIL